MFLKHEERQQGEAEVKVLDTHARLLLRAAEVIERYGHAKGAYGNERGGFCVRGAVLFASREYGMSYELGAHPALRRLEASLGDFSMCWNDANSRTKEEVVAKLRAVAFSS